jgi:hypothetical protein
MYCLCVNVYCHQVTTQLQLINVSYIINTDTLRRTTNSSSHTASAAKFCDVYSFGDWKFIQHVCILCMLLWCKLTEDNQINQPTRCITSQVYCLSFKCSLTCLGHPHAHHQEPINCSSRLWFTVGPTMTNNTATTMFLRLLQLISSWWWAWGRPKHVELYLNDRQ